MGSVGGGALELTAEQAVNQCAYVVDIVAYRISITGVVQGVGFRPFVYNLAVRMGLCGWVLNHSGGVDI